jgi:predicted nucleic-acid-binding Zn-ribbon protein
MNAMNDIMVITPAHLVCHEHSCAVEGDKYTMVRCRRCGEWFCPDHMDLDGEGVTMIRLLSDPKRKTYYQGMCLACATRQHG